MLNVFSRFFFLSATVLFLSAMPGWGKGDPEVYTRWDRSHGMQAGDDIYFLSYYSLYQPGKVIIPMFMVTPVRYHYTDLSLYRLSPGPQDRLEHLWTFGPEISGRGVNLKNCRFARSGDRLYFSWVVVPGTGAEGRPLSALEYDPGTRTGRMVDLTREEKEIAASLDYHHPDTLKRLVLWGRAGLLPLSEWGLPSPLEYSSRDPKFLKKVIVRQMVDRDFRAAALAELDARGEKKILLQILAEARKGSEKSSSFDTLRWEALLRMTQTLIEERPEDIFRAAFENDTLTLARYLDSGGDPDSADERGRTLMMWAIFGGAPDTLELLFERGADHKKESLCGLFPWWYAALSPLREQFLELADN